MGQFRFLKNQVKPKQIEQLFFTFLRGVLISLVMLVKTFPREGQLGLSVAFAIFGIISLRKGQETINYI